MAIEFDDDDFSQKYARKYRKRVMRAISVGFRGLEGEDTTAEGRRVWVWTKIELLEVSAVAVPANRGALARAKGFYESEGEVKSLIDAFDVFKGATAESLEDIRNNLDELKSLLIAEPDGLAERLLGADSEPTSERGGTDTAGQQFKRIEKAFKHGGKSNDT